MLGDGDLISGPWLSLTSHALSLPSLELSVGFQHLLASLLLKSPAPSISRGRCWAFSVTTLDGKTDMAAWFARPPSHWLLIPGVE